MLRPEGAKRIVNINKDVCLTGLENVIPYKLARDIVLKRNQRIIAAECPCRMARDNPCLPLDVCLIIGEPFVSVVAVVDDIVHDDPSLG